MQLRLKSFIPNKEVAIALKEARNEFVRKGIHFLIAFIPLIATFSLIGAIVLLAAGISVYISLESWRLAGFDIPVISRITRIASRPRDRNRFVFGPVTLGLGALLSLVFFSLPAATIAIYALAFGDGFASLIGRSFGKLRPVVLLGKSVEGSAACFFAVFIAAWSASKSLETALAVSLVTTVVEALPLEDFDNIAIPLAAGLVARFFLIA